MFMFQQLKLQCCLHCLTQLHCPSPQFIRNQAPIHRPSHQHYARYHHPWKVYPVLQKTNISFTRWYFHCFEHQNIAVGSGRVLSLHQKEVRFETSFSLAVFWNNKSRVLGTWALFRRQYEHNCKEWGPRSAVRNVLTQLTDLQFTAFSSATSIDCLITSIDLKVTPRDQFCSHPLSLYILCPLMTNRAVHTHTDVPMGSPSLAGMVPFMFLT